MARKMKSEARLNAICGMPYQELVSWRKRFVAHMHLRAAGIYKSNPAKGIAAQQAIDDINKVLAIKEEHERDFKNAWRDARNAFLGE